MASSPRKALKPANAPKSGAASGDAARVFRAPAPTGAPGGRDGAQRVKNELRVGGQPLDAATRSFFEPRFGVDFSQVRVHAGASAAESARAIGARAYTAGQHVVFGSGEYAPQSAAGRHLLAHELTHVVQQQGGLAAAGPEVMRQAVPDAAEEVEAAAGPTVDALLNEWLAEHADHHLSADSAWVLGQWPAGGSMDDLEAGFRADVEALLDFVAGTPGASFTIISYARSSEKQHVMHVAQYLRRNWVGYDRYKFSRWPDVVAAGGRAALLALTPEERATALRAVSNPELLAIVWDTGTAASSRADGITLAEAYNIGFANPVANGGATYSWPTGNTSTSRHEGGNAVDAEPVALPASLVIRRDEASAWPTLAAAQAAFGAANVQHTEATEAEPEAMTVSGLGNIARRDAFLELFFEVRSAARAGFVDPEHFQAP